MFFFFTFLLKFKTRKRQNAVFSSAQAQHTSAEQWCLFAYSLADSVQNNLGIVTDVIRKMIKQAFFFFATFTPSPSLMHVGETLIPFLDFQFGLKCLFQGVAANNFHIQR